MPYIPKNKSSNGSYYSPRENIEPNSYYITDEQAKILVAYNGFVTITPSKDDTVNVIPDIEAWEAWKATQPVPEPLTPAQLREKAYNTQAIIQWDSNMLTVTEAAQKWQYYAAEGNTAKTDELTALIAEAKAKIREQYPDE